MPLSMKDFIRDKDGRVVLWQSPNLLLWSWIILKLISLLLKAGRIKAGFEQLSSAVIFAWALYEFTKGVNYFRKALGLVVLIAVIVGFFK